MSKELKIAIDIALATGNILRERFGFANRVEIKEDRSLVSESDMLAHNFILSELNRHFPDHAVLSEESPNSLHTAVSAKPTWVVDPLDGTSNYLSDIPIFGVAIAFVEKYQTKIGVIYDPMHNELFAAEKGKGATLNGKRISVSKKHVPSGAMLFAGRGYKKELQSRHAKIISVLEQQTTYFRRLGSATIMLAYVASGRADAVILTGNSPWDLIAGSLLVTEAGGNISDYCGKSWNALSSDLVATNGILHDKLIEITRTLEDNTCVL